MGVDRFHVFPLFLSNLYTPSILSKEAFVYFVCPTEIQVPQPPFAWKYYLNVKSWQSLVPTPVSVRKFSVETLVMTHTNGVSTRRIQTRMRESVCVRARVLVEESVLEESMFVQARGEA